MAGLPLSTIHWLMLMTLQLRQLELGRLELEREKALVESSTSASCLASSLARGYLSCDLREETRRRTRGVLDHRDEDLRARNTGQSS